jgi:hypothetical protein
LFEFERQDEASVTVMTQHSSPEGNA